MYKELVQRLRQNNITHVGFAWFEAESYEQVAAVMEDRHRMAPSYAAWLPGALKAEEEFKREGFVTVRAVLRKDEFLANCAAHSQRVDASGRNHFASFVASQVQRNSESS